MEREDRERLVRIEEQTKAIPKLVERVEELESWQNRIKGAVAVIGALFGIHAGIHH